MLLPTFSLSRHFAMKHTRNAILGQQRRVTAFTLTNNRTGPHTLSLSLSATGCHSLFPLPLRKARLPPLGRPRRTHRRSQQRLDGRSARVAPQLRPNLRHVQIERIEDDIVVTVLIVAGRRYLHVRPDGIAQRIVELLAVRIADGRRCGDDDLGQGGNVLVLRRQQDAMMVVVVIGMR